jgi:hypothetical protein
VTKISITIEDIADRKACVSAIRRLFTALEEHYGERAAFHIWISNQDRQTPKWRAREKLQHALVGLESGDQRLIFEYYAMAKPSKEGLARDLAAKNVPLHEKWREWLVAYREWWVQHGEEYRSQAEIIERARGTDSWPPKLPRLPEFPQRPTALFGPRGTTDWRTMHQQIKRVFRMYPDACVAVSEAPIEIRKEELLKAESACSIGVEMQMLGGRPSRLRKARRTRGTKAGDSVPGQRPQYLSNCLVV